MIYKYFEGNIKEATKMQLDSLPLINSLFCEVNPIPVKAALNILGFKYGVPRLPLTKISLEKEKILKEELTKLT